LTSLTSSKVKFKWHSSHQQAFEKVKKVIGTELFLCYPDFNKPVLFHLYTDASDHQLGAVIIQDKKSVAFYSGSIHTAHFKKPFHLYTDASDNQLGAVIMQDKKPISFYSRKLNTAQKRYTTTD
jgi:hypothetical protein